MSLGASLLLDKQMMIDVGYTRGWWTDFSYDSFTDATAEEEKQVNRLMATCSVRF